MTDPAENRAGVPPGDPPAEPGDEDAFFRTLVQRAADAVVTVDENGTVVFANDAVEDVFGYAPSELRGRSLADLVPERHRHLRRAAFDRYLRSGEQTTWGAVEFPGLRADGSEISLSVSFHVQEIGDGGTRLTGIMRDISERKHVERRLDAEERRLELLLDASPVALSVRSVDGELLRWNDRGEEFREALGIENERDAADEVRVYGPDGERLPETDYPFARVVDSEEAVYDVELRVDAPDGGFRWFLVNATPVRDADGAIEQVITAAKDVTALKRYQRRIERERDELRTELGEVFDRITDAFFALNTDWQFTYVNSRAEELLGRSAVDLLGANVWAEFPEAVGSTFQKQYQYALEEQELVTFEAYYSPLETWFEVRAYPSETGLSVYFQDVTERKEHEEELAVRLDQQERVAVFGQRALRAEDLDALMRDAAEMVSDALDTEYCELLELDPEENELLLRQGVGWDAGVAGTATVTADENSHAGYVLRTEDPVVVDDLAAETRFGVPELLSSHDTVSGISVVIGSTDDPWGIFGTHDTERRAFTPQDVHFVQAVANVLTSAIDRAGRERQLRRQNERLESFANMLAHELRNPLTIAQIYLPRAADGDEAASEEVTTALDRIDQMIDLLLIMARGAAPGEREAVALADVAADAWANVPRGGSTLTVETSRTVRSRPSLVRNLFESLLSNAVEHADGDVNVRIGDLDDGFFVADDGPGIPKSDRQTVFEAGFSSRPDGFGLGLTFVAQLADAYGWAVTLSESDGGGVRVEFTGVDGFDDE